MTAERDPVSVLWDRAAAQLLSRARAARGGWAGTRIADPSSRQRAALLQAYGIDPDGPDNPSTARRRGGVNARTRWARGFVRAVYYANDTRHGGPGLALEVEVGAHKPALGVIPAGRAVRLRVRRGGQVAMRAVGRKPDSARIWTDDGVPAGRFSDPSLRDWLAAVELIGDGDARALEGSGELVDAAGHRGEPRVDERVDFFDLAE